MSILLKVNVGIQSLRLYSSIWKLGNYPITEDAKLTLEI